MKRETRVVITPLGAAIVEAMPDQKRMRKIQRDWEEKRYCPTSELFPTQEAIAEFYHRGSERPI